PLVFESVQLCELALGEEVARNVKAEPDAIYDPLDLIGETVGLLQPLERVGPEALVAPRHAGRVQRNVFEQMLRAPSKAEEAARHARETEVAVEFRRRDLRLTPYVFEVSLDRLAKVRRLLLDARRVVVVILDRGEDGVPVRLSLKLVDGFCQLRAAFQQREEF